MMKSSLDKWAGPSGYATREVHALPLWTCAGWQIKPYGIRFGGGLPAAALLDSARRAAAAHAGRLDAEAAGHRLGFAIVHQGSAGHYLLLNWWRDGDILEQRNYQSPLGHWDFDQALRHGATMCVWELAVHWHERNAWVDHMLRRPASPDVEAYLAARMSGHV